MAMFRQPCALAGFCRLAARGAERAAVGRLDVSWRPRTRSSGRRTLFSFIPPSVCPHIPQVKANPVAWLCMCPYTLLRRLIWRPAHEAFYCVVWPFGWSYYGRSGRWYHMSQPMELLVLVWGRLDSSHIARTTFAPVLVVVPLRTIAVCAAHPTIPVCRRSCSLCIVYMTLDGTEPPRT